MLIFVVTPVITLATNSGVTWEIESNKSYVVFLICMFVTTDNIKIDKLKTPTNGNVNLIAHNTPIHNFKHIKLRTRLNFLYFFP